VNRKQKIKQDARALRKYKVRLQNERKVYHQSFQLVAVNNRRSREAALGACVLKALDEVRGLAKKKNIVPGSLYYNIDEVILFDPEGRKGFQEIVTFFFMTYEPAHTKEEIEKEIADTFEKMMQETDELFPLEEEKKDAEEKDCHPGN